MVKIIANQIQAKGNGTFGVNFNELASSLRSSRT